MNELDIIDIIKNNVKYNNNNIVKSIGDDCAVVKLDNNNYLTITTDLMFKSSHFPNILTPFQIGHRVVTANLSDIASMGAKPIGIVLSMGFNNVSKKYIEELSKGINYSTNLYNCPLIGGDTNKSKELTLCGTAFGKVNNPLYRYNSNIGDKIVITNNVGKVYCAFKILELINNNTNKSNKSNKSNKNYLLEKYGPIMEKLYNPIANIEVGIFLSNNKLASSCCDISDGLGKELFYMGNFEINSKQIIKSMSKEVIEFCEEFNLNPVEVALNSGEEWELLFTTNNYNKLNDLNLKINNKNNKINKINKNIKFNKIGKIIEDENNNCYLDGELFNKSKYGYIHKW